MCAFVCCRFHLAWVMQQSCKGPMLPSLVFYVYIFVFVYFLVFVYIIVWDLSAFKFVCVGDFHLGGSCNPAGKACYLLDRWIAGSLRSCVHGISFPLFLTFSNFNVLNQIAHLLFSIWIWNSEVSCINLKSKRSPTLRRKSCCETLKLLKTVLIS